MMTNLRYFVNQKLRQVHIMGTALGFASGVATGGVVATGVSKLIVMTGEGGMPAAANGFAWGSAAGLGVDILIDDKMCKDGM